MKQWNRIFSFLLAVAVLLSAVSVGIFAPLTANAADNGIREAAGHLESAYVEWTPVSGATGYNVYVRSVDSASWTQLDNELIRQYPGYMRADALGLKAGTYQMKVVPLKNGVEQNALKTDNLTVRAHDRSGFAFEKGTSSGAYNEDGTLKSNAVVVYVTDANKNTVTIPVQSNATGTMTDCVGLQAILDGFKRDYDTRPLCIRFIGEIKANGFTLATSKVVNVKNLQNSVTVEGVGEDTTANGWGLTISYSSNVEVRNIGFMNCDSSEGDSITIHTNDHVWVHNCDFFYGEPGDEADKIKGDGALDTKHSTYVTHSYNHFWDCGKVNLQGSGKSDTSNYITYHHNWYDHSDSRHPRVRLASVHVYNNFYDGNAGYGIGAAYKSQIFAEANYFRGCNHPMLISDQGSDTDETMSGEVGGMIKAYGNYIVDAESFLPSTLYPNNYDAVVVSSRNEKLDSSWASLNGGTVYNNFDTAADFYDYTPDAAEDVPAVVTAYAGRVGGGDFQWVFNDEVDDDSSAVNEQMRSALRAYKTELVSIGGNSVEMDGGTDPTEATTAPATEPAPKPTEPSEDPGEDPSETPTTPSEKPSEPSIPVVTSKYIHNFTVNGTSSDFYTITGTLSTSKGSTSYNGLSLTQCLLLDKTSSTVKFTAPSKGTLTMVFGGNTSDKNKKVMVNGTGYTIDANNQVSIEIGAGSYTITRGSSSINLWYVEYAAESTGGDVHTHSYSKIVTAPTCTAQGYTTYTCSCGESYKGDYVSATGHSYSSSVTTQPGCETTGVRTYTCGKCGNSYTESIPATGHSYKAVVTAPTCTTQGYTTYTCSCGSSYKANYVGATGHSYKDGVCTVCGAADPNYVALFNLAGANVDLGNSLTMNFYVNVGDIQGTNYYIEIVKSYGDGTSVTTQIPYAQWESYFGVMWMVKLEGMAAKEMADKIEVTVYTTAGVQVSNTWTDSIRDYCVRQLNNASQSAAYTLLVDMLNYGAAAQVNFGYNTGDLANSTLTAAQKNYATKNFNMGDYTNNMVVGTNFIGSSLSLETNIVLSMYFNKPASTNGLVAKISYTDHLGVLQTYEVAEADFLTLGAFHGVAVDTLVASDVRQLVTLEVYDGNKLVVYGADSMESYAVRQGGDINTALMIFTLSAYDYLH